ncbi:MAG TPA: HAD family phosphatase, partial [Terriglobia bacterium]|nr:HAD family phosphatase [Terriglobia bacterium]
MAEISALFWDVGGVLLTNGWDRRSRERAAQKFRLDWEDFEDRHELVVSRFETGKLSLDRYLDRTIFYRERDFAQDVFKHYMFD